MDMQALQEATQGLGISASTLQHFATQLNELKEEDEYDSKISEISSAITEPTTTSFELGEDKPQMTQGRIEQEEMWGNAKVNVRQQLSNREALLQKNIRVQMKQAIKDFHAVNMLTKWEEFTPEVLMIIIGYSVSGAAPLIPHAINHMQRDNLDDTKEMVEARKEKIGGFRICVRKRPMLQVERDLNEYSVVNAGNKRSILLHEGKISRSGNRLSMTHKRFHFDRVFDEMSTNEDVTKDVVELLYKRSTSGLNCTLICYGQTGTGKTYTVMGALRKVAQLLNKGGVLDNDETLSAEVSFLELHGKKCYDLIQERKEIRLMSDKDEKVHARGIITKTVAMGKANSEQQFNYILEPALALRSVEVTERNPISSRSHAVCRVKFSSGGELTVVDLAGSERNYETIQMTPRQHRESAEINKALMALKDCIRAQHEKKLKAPYRANLLTRVLRDCFVDEAHTTTIIATVSPTTTDCFHTLNTLDHVSLMMPPMENLKMRVGGSGAGFSARANIEGVTVQVPLVSGAAGLSKPVGEWSCEEVKAWIGVADGGKFAHIVLPPNMTGEKLMTLNEQSLKSLFAVDFNAANSMARGAGEGQAWVAGEGEEGEGQEEEERNTRELEVGRALWGALRMEVKQARGIKIKKEKSFPIF